jgi:ribonuclease HI
MKYYAVKEGHKTGIFTSWDKVQPLVSGYKGAVHKSFSSLKDAELWMNGGSSKPPSPKVVTCYTDGSARNGKAGYGVITLRPSGEETENYGPLPYDKPTNNRAELYAIYVALTITQDEKEIEIITDSQYSIGCLTIHIHSWLRASPDGTLDYLGDSKANLDIIWSTYQLLIGRVVRFQHVNGHSGNYYNEKVDKLAEQGCAMYGNDNAN